jgi:TolB protein
MRLFPPYTARHPGAAHDIRLRTLCVRPCALLAAIVMVVASAICATNARAQDSVPSTGVTLGLNYALGTRPGILVLPTITDAPDSVRTIIQRDLDYDDRATVIALDQDAANGLIPKAAGKFNFPLIAKLGVVALIYPRTTLGGLTVTMYDVGQKKAIRTETFPLPTEPNTEAWRMALHDVSDQIGKWIFGTPGAAATRILYCYQEQVWQIDNDGANPKKLTSGRLAMSPAWHPDGQKMAYVGFTTRGSQIAIYNFATGETHWNNATQRGLNITPAFSPDGKTIAYSNGREDGTELVLANADDNESARRVTVGRGSDNTSPSYSPDGRRIAFMSGRSGHPEIYIMDSDGTNARMLTEFTYGDKSYRASPDWSPDGRMIAYESQIGGDFQILTIDLRDGTTKQYTSDGVNEDPSWAPDARHLVFSSTRSGPRQLWVVDVETGRLRQLTHQSGARLPAWSPLLKIGQ